MDATILSEKSTDSRQPVLSHVGKVLPSIKPKDATQEEQACCWRPTPCPSPIPRLNHKVVLVGQWHEGLFDNSSDSPVRPAYCSVHDGDWVDVCWDDFKRDDDSWVQNQWAGK
jgi:hypothetical protein